MTLWITKFKKWGRVYDFLNDYACEELIHAALISLFSSGIKDASKALKELSRDLRTAEKEFNKIFDIHNQKPKPYKPDEALAMQVQGKFAQNALTV